MRRFFRHVTLLTVLATLAGLGAFLVLAATIEESFSYTPTFTVSYTAPPEVSAMSVIIIDTDTNTLVYEKRADDVLPIASITKIFSSALYWSEGEPLDRVTVTAGDVATEGRSGRLAAGQTYQRRELLFPALLESSNDASATMARTASVDLLAAMNTYAETHGAVKTHFADASGLSDTNVSTARELALLFTALRQTHAHIIDVTQLPNYLNHVNAWLNNSPFASDPSFRGGKHGYTYAANRTAVAQFEEEIGGTPRTFTYVLLGSDDLARDMQILRDFTQSATRFE